MVFIDDLWNVVHGFFNELIVGPLKSKMAEIRHLENQYYVIFLPCRGRSNWDKMPQTCAE